MAGVWQPRCRVCKRLIIAAGRCYDCTPGVSPRTFAPAEWRFTGALGQATKHLKGTKHGSNRKAA